MKNVKESMKKMEKAYKNVKKSMNKFERKYEKT